MYRTKAISYDLRAKIFWTLAMLAIILSGTYIYAVSATIKNVAGRQEFERSLGSLTTRQSELEFAYIEAREGIVPSTARDEGFKSVGKVVYVSRSGPGALSLNTEDSR